MCAGSKASMGQACGTVGPRSTRRREPGPENPCVTSARSLILFVQHTSQKAFVCLSPAPSPQGVGLCYQPHLMEEHLMAQRVGFSRGYPVSAKSQTLNLGPGFCCSTAVVSHGESRGPGRQQCLLSLPPPAFLCWVWLWGICWGARGGSYQKVLCQRAQLTCQQSPFGDELVRFDGSPPPR